MTESWFVERHIEISGRQWGRYLRAKKVSSKKQGRDFHVTLANSGGQDECYWVRPSKFLEYKDADS
jgi:hypothetical protein